MLYHLLYPLHDQFALFNVFRYLSFRTIYAILTALVVCWILGPPLIRYLRRLQVGQVIREEAPQNHRSKEGTPTMGGILLVLAILCSTLLWADLTNPYVWITLGTLLGLTGVGFLDDYLKVVRRDPRGLRPLYKFSAQLLVAGAVGGILYAYPGYSTQLNLPFLKTLQPDLGWLYIPFVILVIVSASNAVNLTDGLDGLAIGPVMIAALVYLVVTYVTGHAVFADYLLIPHIPGAGELAVFCGAMLGAGLGFLWFNAYPASIFMGDVGSLPLGGALATVAVVSKHELLLVLVGGIFVLEAISVIFQVASYRIRGRRVFRMAPLHHHFELKGWEEPKIVVRFWILAIVLALLSLSTLKLR